MSDVTVLLLTSSATTLGGQYASYQNVFSPLPVNDDTFFDEGPRVPRNKTRVTTSQSGSIDTSAIDAFAQGVEITNQARYDAGLVKIWSGEPGHRLLNTRFGEDKNFFPDPGFVEMDLFDPVRFLEAQETESPLWWNLLTYPIVTGDNDQAENFNFNGVIEPLTIRPLVAFFSTEVPFEAHTIRAGLQGGNDNQLLGTDRILTVDYFEPSQEAISYLDMVDMFEGRPTNGFFRFEFTPLLPFSDVRLVRNTLPNGDLEPADMVAALSLMTGSTDNYVTFNQRSSTCGWDYDNTAAVGTDSLSFGGMTY